MSELPSDWAIVRAFRLSGYIDARAAEFKNGSVINGRSYLQAFALYIEEHEEAPVDPIRLEARRLCDGWWPGERALTGSMDNEAWQERIETALRRGIEIAKGGEA